jgi:hypothetical protein
MSQPVQHHYLPKEAYLKFFESPDKEDFVWLYQRNEKTILVNTKNVAKERHLYSFTDESGKHDTQLESALAEMEEVVSKILTKINNSDIPIVLTVQEKMDLSYFLAMQVARTPAFRDTLKLQTSEFAKLHMQMLVSDEDVFAHAMEEIKKEEPSVPDIGIKEMQDFVFGEKYTINMSNENYFLKQAIQLGDHLYPTIMMKDMFVLRSPSVEIITSDYPVVLISNPNIPDFYAGGFLMSGILIPIGTNSVLFCKNPDDPKIPPSTNDEFLVGYKEIPPAYARWINKVIIGHAERFLFSSTENSKIKNIFDKTSIPKRFHMSSPFSNKSV